MSQALIQGAISESSDEVVVPKSQVPRGDIFWHAVPDPDRLLGASRTSKENADDDATQHQGPGVARGCFLGTNSIRPSR